MWGSVAEPLDAALPSLVMAQPGGQSGAMTRASSLWFRGLITSADTAPAVEDALGIELRPTPSFADLRTNGQNDERVNVYDLVPHMLGYGRFEDTSAIVTIAPTSRAEFIIDALTARGLSLLQRYDWNETLPRGEQIVLRELGCPACRCSTAVLYAQIDLDSGRPYLECDEVEEGWWSAPPTPEPDMYPERDLFDSRPAGWEDLAAAGWDRDLFRSMRTGFA